MAKQQDGYRRPQVPPEQTRVNVQRQAPQAPPSDGDEEGTTFDAMDPQDQPELVPDRLDNGPVFDTADAPPPLFDRDDMDPDEELDDGDDVEIRRGADRKRE